MGKYDLVKAVFQKLNKDFENSGTFSVLLNFYFLEIMRPLASVSERITHPTNTYVVYQGAVN